jgi:hypothetical protein
MSTEDRLRKRMRDFDEVAAASDLRTFTYIQPQMGWQEKFDERGSLMSALKRVMTEDFLFAIKENDVRTTMHRVKAIMSDVGIPQQGELRHVVDSILMQIVVTKTYSLFNPYDQSPGSSGWLKNWDCWKEVKTFSSTRMMKEAFDQIATARKEFPELYNRMRSEGERVLGVSGYMLELIGKEVKHAKDDELDKLEQDILNVGLNDKRTERRYIGIIDKRRNELRRQQ